MKFQNYQKILFVFVIFCIVFTPQISDAFLQQAVTWVTKTAGDVAGKVGEFALDRIYDSIDTNIRFATWPFVQVMILFAGMAGIFFDWMAALSFGAELGNGVSIYKLVTTGNVGAIALVWSILRDLVNVIFIFIVIYIGIMTILGILSGDLKKLLLRIIVAAIFINFSLLLTGLVIDASNVLAIGFYNAFPESEDLKSLATFITPPGSRSLSLPMSKTTGLKDAFGIDVHQRITTTNGTPVPSSSGAGSGRGTLNNITTGILLFIVGIILITAGFLLLTRTVVLIILMVLSPLAIAAYALPNDKGKTYFNQWKNHLIHHAFWAPAFMIMYYVSVQIIQEFSIANEVAKGSGKFSGLILQIINTFIVAGFLWSSLIISKKLADYGNTAIGKLNKRLLGSRDKFGGFAGRNTFGRGAKRLLDSETADNLRRSNSFLGRNLVLNPLSKAASRSVAGRESFTGMEERRRKEVDTSIKLDRSNPQGLAKYIGNLKGEEQVYAYEKLSAKDRVATEEHLAPGTKAYLRTHLTPEEKEKTEDAFKEMRKKAQSQAVRNVMQDFATVGMTSTVNPRTGVPYTAQEAGMELKVKDARKLTKEARKSPSVVQNLSTRHLGDMMAEGELEPDEVAEMMNIITGPAYPNQGTHMAYVNNPVNIHLWT